MLFSSSSCPSEWLWDHLETETLSKQEEELLWRHIETCPMCQKRHQVRKDNLAFLVEQKEWDYSIQSHSHVPRASSLDSGQSFFEWLIPFTQLLQRWRWAIVCLTLCILPVSLFSFGVFERPSLLSLPPQIRPTYTGQTKGQEPSIQMLHYRMGSTVSQWTSHGEILHPGDLVQFDYVVQKRMHLLVLSANERGELFVYVPLNGKKSVVLTKRKGTWPPHTSLELDQSLGYERIWMLCSTQPIYANDAKNWIQHALKRGQKQLRTLDVQHPHWFVFSVLIRKSKSKRIPSFLPSLELK